MSVYLVQHSGRLEVIGAGQSCHTRHDSSRCRHAVRIGDKELQVWIEEGLRDTIEPLVGSNVSLFLLYDDLIAVTTDDKAFKTYATTVVAWGLVVSIVFVGSVLLRQVSTYPGVYLVAPFGFWGLIAAWRQMAVARAAAGFPNALLARKKPHEDTSV